MPVGQKRVRISTHDFNIKVDDPDAIKQILSYKMPVFKDFAKGLNAQQLQEWSEYSLRQKNFDRVIEYTTDELQMKKDFEVQVKL